MSRILILAAAAVLFATPAMALSVQAMPKNPDGTARFAEPSNPFANAMPQVTYNSDPYGYPLGFGDSAFSSRRYGDNFIDRSIPAPARESNRALQRSVEENGLWVMRPNDDGTDR